MDKEVHMTIKYFNGTSPILLHPILEEHDSGLVSQVNASVVLGILISITTLSVIGNAVVVVVVANDRKLHRAPFYFLLFICGTDLCRGLLCLPFSMSAVLQGFMWPYGDHSCTAMAFVNSFLVYSSAIGLLAVAIDRYISVTFPPFYSKCSHALVNLAIIILGLGVAFCLSFPPIFEHGSYLFVEGEIQCTFYHKPYRDNDTLGYAVSFICILAISTFFYMRLFAFLRTRRRMAPLDHEPARSDNWTFFGPGANGQALINMLNGFTGIPTNPFAATVQNMGAQAFGRVVNLRVVRNEHLTRLFFASSSVYILLWIPYLCQVMFKVFRETEHLPVTFIIASTLLSHSQVAVCPYVYLLFGSAIRSSLFSRLQQWRMRSFYSSVDQNSGEQVPSTGIRCIELAV